MGTNGAISGKAMLAGVMGDPVAHSLSPKLHNHWITQYNLDAAYVPLAVTPPDLADAFRLLPKIGFKGWNLTVPHKEQALALVDEVDDAARVIGAVNTVVVRENGTLLGSNTDALGFIRNLQAQVPDLSPYKNKAVVLGAGGAARAICKALVDAGFKHIVVVNRTSSRAETIASAMGSAFSIAPWDEAGTALADAGLLVNATTLGMHGQPPLTLSLDALPKTALVADIVYAPLDTELLKAARARGCKTVTGIGMLIHQAAPGFAAWFGVQPEVTAGLEKLLLS